MRSHLQWDTLISNALVFDGSGELPQQIDIAIKDGRIAAKGLGLPQELASEVIDGSGQWLMPGLLDIHTHLDLEVEIDPRLPEVVRHGTTTVLVGNCSLGLSFGSQLVGNSNPIVDCFTRVENIPKTVLAKCVEAVTWDNSKDYLDHFADMPLGPNVAAFVPHSMLRVEVMGLQDSIDREPTEAELQRMTGLLQQAMDEGYLGLSTDGLPFHYMANAPNTDKRIPTQFASHAELKRLLQVLRDYDRVWQTTPILQSKLKAFWYFMFTSGRLFGKTLKTSALAAVDFALMPGSVKGFVGFAGLMNSRLFKGNMHFQALGTNFRMWSDGVVSPIYEELDSTCKIIAKEYDDVAGRKALLDDPAFVADFRRDWLDGRDGKGVSGLKTRFGLPDKNVIRDLWRMRFDGAPVADWEGESLQQVFERMQRFQAGDSSQARSAAEADAFASCSSSLQDDADFMLFLLRTYDKDFRYWVDQANDREESILPLLLDKNTMPGFNDSGAHLTNMAFFDANLMSLKRAQADSMATVATMVKRLTSEPAAFFGLDVGTLELGAQADITMIDPQALAVHDDNANRQFVYRDIFEHKQMVSRSDGVVTQVLINGQVVWRNNEFSEVLGTATLGRALRAGPVAQPLLRSA